MNLFLETSRAVFHLVINNLTVGSQIHAELIQHSFYAAAPSDCNYGRSPVQ